MRWIRRILYTGLIFVLLLVLVLWLSSVMIRKVSIDYVYDNMGNLPTTQVAVVLGTSRYTINGQRNVHYYARLNAAIRLFRKHKISYLVVSGDNKSPFYNEPARMKQYLVAQGVPPEVIYCDYAGFRTLDSVVRAKKVFGQDHFIIVSQRYQTERAVYIARKYGIDAIGFNAQGAFSRLDIRNQLRVRFARLLAVIQVNFFHTQPYFLGPVIIPGKSPPS